jgi:hypothetical protein
VELRGATVNDPGIGLRIPKKDSDGSWRLLRAKIEKALHEGHDPWYYL